MRTRARMCIRVARPLALEILCIDLGLKRLEVAGELLIDGLGRLVMPVVQKQMREVVEYRWHPETGRDGNRQPLDGFLYVGEDRFGPDGRSDERRVEQIFGYLCIGHTLLYDDSN